MSINRKLELTLQRALTDRVISSAKCEKILGEVQTAEDVVHIVAGLQDAYRANVRTPLDLGDAVRSKTLNAFLSALGKVSPPRLTIGQRRGALGDGVPGGSR